MKDKHRGGSVEFAKVRSAVIILAKMNELLSSDLYVLFHFAC